MKTYYLSDSEKDYIRKNSKSIPIKDIAINLSRSQSPIRAFIKKECLDYTNDTKLQFKTYNNVSFSPMEFKVFTLISKGYSNKKICKELQIFESTLRTHWENIRLNLGLEKADFEGSSSVMRVNAVLWYLKNVKGLDLGDE